MLVTGEFGTYSVIATPFASGGAGQLFPCSPGDVIYKKYFHAVTDRAEISQLLHLRDIGRRLLVRGRQELASTPEASVNWPLDTVTDRATGAVVGIVLPRIP